MNTFAKNALIALFITALISITIIFAVNLLNNARITELKAIEEQLTTDTLSIETQFALLEDAPCEGVKDGSILGATLGDIGDRLVYTESRLPANDPTVQALRERYTLIQIRDYILTKRIARTCNIDPVTVLYFYSNEKDACEECDRAAYTLSYLRETYPSLRVYSFDYNLDLPALKTLISVEKVKGPFPAFVIEDKNINGFTSLEEFQKHLPKSLLDTAPTSTSTLPAKK
jgi:hypothetical protein